MQFILESILPLSIPPSLFLCAVTRSIMGLSYSRRDVDALSSIWNDSPLTLACSPPCLAGLEAVQSENHDYNGLWRVIHASYAKLFSLLHLPFFPPYKRKPFLFNWLCVSWWCVCTHTSSERLSTPTMHYHNTVRSVKKACCNVKRKLPLVEFPQTYQK